MTERIKQILDQCINKDMADKPWPLVDTDKFAKLIIQECIESVKQDMHSGHSHSDFSTGYDAALEIAVCNIEEKFGIE